MKIISFLLLSGLASSASTASLHHPSPAVSAISTAKTLSAIQEIRGGGTPVKPSDITKIYAAFYGFNGVVGMPAPETTSNFGDFPVLEEGTTDYVICENLGSVSLGYALLVYLTTTKRTSMPLHKAIAFAGLPCTYIQYKNLLKGVSRKLGGEGPTALLTTAFMVGISYGLFTGKGDSEFLSKIYVIPTLLLGIVSEISPEAGMKMSSMGTATSNSGKAFYMWWASLMTGFGALALLLLNGKDPIQSVGMVAALQTLFMMDCVWLRKWNVGVAPAASNYVFLAVPFLTALGILWQQHDAVPELVK
jgi:hypothetical protein